jgi:UDP-glucose 4-epimerase
MSNSILITGGCGFIGSHLVDSLIEEGNYITVVDDLSADTDIRYLQPHIDNEKAEFYKFDIRDYNKLKSIGREFDYVFHLAAQPDVRVSVEQPRKDFDVNINGTFNILELMREKEIPKLIFASSLGTVYGEPDVFPTPETYRLNPISNYGAAKAAAEMYCSSYSYLYDIDIVALRLGNIYGPRSTHGVMFDFYNKLMKDPINLEILGDGNQTKTYLYIKDTISAFDILFKNMRKGFECFNVSSNETTKVIDIANEFVEVLELQDVKFSFTGGERGWMGDVIYTSVDTSRLESLGWQSKIPIKEGIRLYLKWLASKT